MNAQARAVRGVKHYMQRTALQGSPRLLSQTVGIFLPGAEKIEASVHPFRLKMSELPIGTPLTTPPRTITLEDIEHFAHFTGDNFYAHMDEEAAAANPLFGGRVALAETDPRVSAPRLHRKTPSNSLLLGLSSRAGSRWNPGRIWDFRERREVTKQHIFVPCHY